MDKIKDYVYKFYNSYLANAGIFLEDTILLFIIVSLFLVIIDLLLYKVAGIAGLLGGLLLSWVTVVGTGIVITKDRW